MESDSQESYNEEDFVVASPEHEAELDSALGLEVVSVRMDKDLAQQLKDIAKQKNTPVQSLIRWLLEDYVSAVDYQQGESYNIQQKIEIVEKPNYDTQEWD